MHQGAPTPPPNPPRRAQDRRTHPTKPPTHRLHTHIHIVLHIYMHSHAKYTLEQKSKYAARDQTIQFKMSTAPNNTLSKMQQYDLTLTVISGIKIIEQ